MIGRLFRGSLKGTPKRRGNSRVRLGQLDANQFAVAADLASPILLALTVHAVQTTKCVTGFNRFGDRAQLAMK